jgi:hypothetical protein
MPQYGDLQILHPGSRRAMNTPSSKATECPIADRAIAPPSIGLHDRGA